MTRIVLALLLCLAAAPALAQAGRWITESGNLEVEIAPCAAGQPASLCGTVTKVLANRSMRAPGAEMVAADARPALGMQILTGFVSSDDGDWDGEIYNRENGKTYSCTMKLAAPDALELRAYVLLPLFGKTQTWRRAAAAE